VTPDLFAPAAQRIPLERDLGLEHGHGSSSDLDRFGTTLGDVDSDLHCPQPSDGFSLLAFECEAATIVRDETMLNEIRSEWAVGVACYRVLRDSDGRCEHAAGGQDATEGVGQDENEIAVAANLSADLRQFLKVRLEAVQRGPLADADQDIRGGRGDKVDWASTPGRITLESPLREGIHLVLSVVRRRRNCPFCGATSRTSFTCSR